MATVPVVLEPRRAYAYSNYGFGLLGLVVERASGLAYRDLVTREILRPLGIASTAWTRAEIPEAARSRSYGEAGAVEEVALDALAPAGGLYLSVPDLARWGAWHAAAFEPGALASDDPVAAATVREVLAPRAEPVPAATGPSYLHGLGWDALDACGTRMLWKMGGLEEYRALVTVLPHHGIVVATAVNGRADLWSLHGVVLDGFEESRALVPRQLHPSPPLLRAADALLALYAGPTEPRYASIYTPYFQSAIPFPAHAAMLDGLRAELGRCRLGEDHVVRHRHAATLELACERGAASLRLELDGRGERVATMWWSRKKPPAAPCTPPWR
jgi:hypothetical protein